MNLSTLYELDHEIAKNKAELRRLSLRVQEKRHVTPKDWAALVDCQQAMLKTTLAANELLLGMLKQRRSISLN